MRKRGSGWELLKFTRVDWQTQIEKLNWCSSHLMRQINTSFECGIKLMAKLKAKLVVGQIGVKLVTIDH